MHEGQNLIEQWARALEKTPTAEIAAQLTTREQTEELTGASGGKYKLTLEVLWANEGEGGSDFYVLLRLRPASGLRRFRVWRANLVATYNRDEKRMNPMLWVQRPQEA